MEELPHWLTMSLAGLGGACVFAMIQPDRKSWLRSLASIVVGFKAALWLTPALCEWRGYESIHVQHAVAFSVGLIGNPLCRLILSEATAEAATVIKDAVARFFNRKNGGGEPPPRGKHPRPDSDNFGGGI